ncbi:MAG TPA: ChaN family lipoprotein [Pseudomonas sp.]|nr:ChaN family lipoprotein [Pseudomonas sp.]
MRILWFCCLALLAACHSLPPLPAWQSPEGRAHAELGVIVDLHSGARLTPAQLVERLAPAERLLVGEQHDNPDHHALQLWLLQALASERRPGALLLEMLNPEQQARVDGLRGPAARGEWPADLPAALAWQKGWDWALYGPLVRHALAQPELLLAANLDPAEIGRIYRAVPDLQGPRSTTPAVREALLGQIRESHCNLLPASQLPAMLAVQQQRDRRMAERLLAAPAPAVLLAGAYHVRRDLGVPLHLADLGAAAGTQVLLLAEVGQPVSAAQADFVWYTPAPLAQDRCAALRQRRKP